MTAATVAVPLPKRSINPWLVAVAVVIPTFMEVLDTTIANVALRYIAGGLSAPATDSEWVITSYLAANAIILPISGWLASRLGRRNYFLLSIAIFTLASALCGMAVSLDRPDRVPRPAGAGRGRTATLEPGGAVGCLPAGEAGRGDDDLRGGGAARSGRRADPRGLHHGQLRLALDLLPECARRAAGSLSVPRRGGGPGLSTGRTGAGARSAPAVRYARAVPAERHHGLLGGPSQQRAGMGLAGRSVLSRADAAVPVRALPVGPDLPGVADRQSAHQPPDPPRPEFPRLLHHHLLRLRRALRQHDLSSRAAPVALRLRRDDVGPGPVAGGGVRHRDALRRRHAAESRARRPLPDGRRPAHDGRWELLDVAPHLGHRALAGRLAAGWW